MFKTRLKTSFRLIDLAPLVDVVFLMLVFFVVTSEVLPLKSLRVIPPAINDNAEALTSQIVIVIDRENVIFVGPAKEIVDLQDLKLWLVKAIDQLKKKGGERPSLVLVVDKEAPYGTFFPVFHALQAFSLPVRLVYRDVAI